MATKIEWVRNSDGTAGESWNPIRARRKSDGKVGWFCTKVSTGCTHCYSERMNNRMGTALPYTAASLDEIEVFLDRKVLQKPLHWTRKARTVFVCSMTDLFHEVVPIHVISQIFELMSQARQHTFQVLTKRPERALEFYLWAKKIDGWAFGYPNVWLGTSVENQAAADERIPWLLQTPAAVRFVSCEPLLGAVDLSQPYVDYLEGWDVEAVHVCGGDERVCHRRCPEAQQYQTERLDWVICGGESGPGARPMKLDWARSLVQQCKSAGVPVFVKQMGTVWPKNQYLQGKSLYAYGDTKGHEMKYWPEDLRVREMPAQAQEVEP